MARAVKDVGGSGLERFDDTAGDAATGVSGRIRLLIVDRGMNNHCAADDTVLAIAAH